MCRWLAYSGPPIFLDTLIFKPENSLATQSLTAQESVTTTNGDGFGIGWYGEKPEPGQFRDILPAWNDANLHAVSEQIASRLFFAHVRASTGTPTSRTNCHPFRHGRHLFMHNGQIGGFERIRRELALRVRPELFRHLQGTTDSELFFFLLLGHGLDADPDAAFARAVAEVLDVMTEAGIAEPFRMTAAVSDGEGIHALRYASDDRAPTLYYGSTERRPTGDSVLILSEPLDQRAGNWTAMPQAHMLSAADGTVAVTPFSPTG